MSWTRRFIRWLARYELALEKMSGESVGQFDGFVSGYRKGYEDGERYSP